MGIAEFIIGRAFARPVGSTDPTSSRCDFVRPGLNKSSSAPDQQRTTPQAQRAAQHPGHEGVPHLKR
jgi:hypothetical protein